MRSSGPRVTCTYMSAKGAPTHHQVGCGGACTALPHHRKMTLALFVRSSAPRMTCTSSSLSVPPKPAPLPCRSTSALSCARRNSACSGEGNKVRAAGGGRGNAKAHAGVGAVEGTGEGPLPCSSTSAFDCRAGAAPARKSVEGGETGRGTPADTQRSGAGASAPAGEEAHGDYLRGSGWSGRSGMHAVPESVRHGVQCARRSPWHSATAEASRRGAPVRRRAVLDTSQRPTGTPSTCPFPTLHPR